MKKQKILNYRQVGNYLRGRSEKLQGTFIPQRYKAAVMELEMLVERWKETHKPE